jgi:hypothetical protein
MLNDFNGGARFTSYSSKQMIADFWMRRKEALRQA